MPPTLHSDKASICSHCSLGRTSENCVVHSAQEVGEMVGATVGSDVVGMYDGDSDGYRLGLVDGL